MKMELGLDTGPMIKTVRTPITPSDTADTLMTRLAELGAELLVDALKTPNELTWVPQPEEGVTYAEKLLKSESPIDWTQSAQSIVNKIQAFNPFPGTTFIKDNIVVKIWAAEAVDQTGKPGEVLSVKEGLIVACGQGAIKATILQKPGKPRMPAQSFLQSLNFIVGEMIQ